MKGFLEFLDDWGIKIGYMIAGAAGAFISMKKDRKKNRSVWQKVFIVFAGVVSANFGTPLVVWLLDIPKGIEGGIAFAVGYSGLNGFSYFLDFLKEKNTRHSKHK